jgi:hypothetical protein
VVTSRNDPFGRRRRSTGRICGSKSSVRGLDETQPWHGLIRSRNAASQTESNTSSDGTEGRGRIKVEHWLAERRINRGPAAVSKLPSFDCTSTASASSTY